jgi:hypothetical protein
LRIAYQNRPRIFDRHIRLPELLYSDVIEVDERIGARGEVLLALDAKALAAAERDLLAAFAGGYRSLALVLMHGYRFPAHEQQLAALARRIGFSQVSVSHEVSPLMKLVSRGDTTVVDAYLSPILRRYIDRVAAELQGAYTTPGGVAAVVVVGAGGGHTTHLPAPACALVLASCWAMGIAASYRADCPAPTAMLLFSRPRLLACWFARVAALSISGPPASSTLVSWPCTVASLPGVHAVVPACAAAALAVVGGLAM